ncbi:MAG: precorrin-6Y C5,15-methyltransferase (decarboxylating) subunit CbiT [Negativicutes bacterium]|nr:precorrin-6Y C5,15-methyltransferase (decarboxylating) subunit CbiT [Negativicutes bacterium]
MKEHSLGIADELFIRGDIPMTKQEVRILALAKARIGPRDSVIDIGAGTGSLTVEAALLARQGRVFAVEREQAGIGLIRTNAARFEAGNITVIEGSAPEALTGLPAADVIFIGGSGGQLASILETSDQLLKAGGRLVIMAVTPETLHEALTGLESRGGYAVEASGLQVTRLRQAGTKHLFQALNPVYIIAATKGGSHDR